MSLSLKCRTLDAFIRDVENWFFVYHGESFPPPSFEKTPRAFFLKHENITIAGHVEFHGLGKIQKVVTVGSDKYRLTEIPEDVYTTILDELMSDGKDHLLPKLFLMDPDSKIPKFRLVALWFPPGNYVKELREKRGVITQEEFKIIEPILKGMYDQHGLKVPSYVDGKTFVQVSDKVQ